MTEKVATLDDVLAALAYEEGRIDRLQKEIDGLRKENDDLKAAAKLTPAAAHAAEQGKIDDAMAAVKKNVAKIDALKV